MYPFGLVVRFVLKDGATEGFDALMRATLEGIRAHEPGTLMYTVHEVEGEPAQRVTPRRTCCSIDQGKSGPTLRRWPARWLRRGR